MIINFSSWTHCQASIDPPAVLGHHFRRRLDRTWLTRTFLRPYQTICPTSVSSMLNVPKERWRLERLLLSQLGNCQKRINALCLRAARGISAVPSLSPHIIPACQIVRAIRRGQWTSTQVVTAFIKSAIRAQDETNCVTEGLPLS